jgi:hypothetical protein
VCHEQVYHQHLIYRASLNLYPTTEQVMVNVLDFHLVMYHLHLDELNEHVVLQSFVYKNKNLHGNDLFTFDMKEASCFIAT